MGQFLEKERVRQADFKVSSPYFTESAKVEGIYRKRLRPFCLPLEHAEENLFSKIRRAALNYFAQPDFYGQKIKWHDGQNDKPSNHLCSSQVCCVNFLFPFVTNPNALSELLHPIFPNIRQMLPIESPNRFVSFEWIGQKNYLKEKIPRSGKRTRGANCTSVDAAVMFEREDGVRQIVLIEWKYTESYGNTSLKISKSGTDRTRIYEPLWEREDCPMNKFLISHFEMLFYEPFYQLMRQQFLANEMKKAKELGAEVVSVLHISPAHNHDFSTITSPALRSLGTSAIEVWKRIVRTPGSFISVNTEELFSSMGKDQFPDLSPWWRYITQRYSWLQS